jgi:hypothetical protein
LFRKKNNFLETRNYDPFCCLNSGNSRKNCHFLGENIFEILTLTPRSSSHPQANNHSDAKRAGDASDRDDASDDDDIDDTHDNSNDAAGDEASILRRRGDRH